MLKEETEKYRKQIVWKRLYKTSKYPSLGREEKRLTLDLLTSRAPDLFGV